MKKLFVCIMKLMCLVSLVSVLFGILSLSSSAVQIHQVYYDPVSTESGGEAIELYNPDPYDIDIGGWIIATESSEKDAVLPANSSIPAKGFFLIADDGWDEKKDNPDWRSADFTTPITMNNDDSGIALRNSSGALLDALGWGSASGIKEGLFSNSPAADIPPGRALLRIDSTDDNSNDFIEADPSFLGDNVIPLEVNVSDSVSNPSAYVLEGNIIKPTAGVNKSIHVRSKSAGVATFLNSSKALNQVDTDVYEAIFAVPYYLPAGNYSVLFSDNSELKFEYAALKSFDVISEKISFNVVPGSSSVSSKKAVIKNSGNVDLVMSLGLSSNSSLLAPSNFKYSLDNKEFSEFSEPFELLSGSEQNIWFKINIPEDTELGTYSSLISINSKN